MIVKVLHSAAGPKYSLRKGQVTDLGNDLAKELVKGKIVREATPGEKLQYEEEAKKKAAVKKTQVEAQKRRSAENLSKGKKILDDIKGSIADYEKSPSPGLRQHIAQKTKEAAILVGDDKTSCAKIKKIKYLLYPIEKQRDEERKNNKA